MSHETNEAAKQSVTDCNHLGDAAKMREALNGALEAIKTLSKTHNDDLPEDVRAILGGIAFDATEALAAPTRNCDRPECATSKAAQDVWRKEDGGKTAYYEWLLDEAKGGAN